MPRLLAIVVAVALPSGLPIQGAVIQGSGMALCGEQNIFTLAPPAPAGRYHWHVEWKDSRGRPQAWDGNANEPVINLAFIGEPGLHRIAIVDDQGGVSPPFSVEALPPSARRLPDKPLVVSMEPLPNLPSMNASRLNARSTTPPRSPIPVLPLPDAGVAGYQPLSGSAKPFVDPPSAPRYFVKSPAFSTQSATDEGLTIVQPNTDGVLDLSISTQPEEIDPVPNPFRVRYKPRLQLRDVPLSVGLVFLGDTAGNASVVINDQPYSIGDSFEGLTVSAISAESIELRDSKAIVRFPVQDKALTLRLIR